MVCFLMNTIQQCLPFFNFVYSLNRYDPKFSDRQVWANLVDPDQTSPLIWVYTVCHSVCMFWMPFSTLKPRCLNFRIITAKFSGVRIFRMFTVLLKDPSLGMFCAFSKGPFEPHHEKTCLPGLRPG